MPHKFENLYLCFYIIWIFFFDTCACCCGIVQLESNLHHLALSAEWLKHVDSLATLGSASHIVIASSRASKHAIGRKKARLLDPEGNPSSNGAGGLSLCWWRGGRVSCQLFSWKVLPRSIVSKAARQGLQFFFFILSLT